MGNTGKFLTNENLKYLPSLSKCGEIHSDIKSELVKCTEMFPLILIGTEAPGTSGTNLEGSVIVIMGKPEKNKSLKDYCSD